VSAADVAESVAIYDLRGRRVRDLGTIDLVARGGRFDWRADDDRGRRVSRGVYLLRARIDGARVTARVLLP